MDSRKKEVDAEFTRCYTLSPEAFKQLIADKIKRNIMYSKADTNEQERQVLELAE
jgi:RecA/RadA recombinase